VPTITGLHHLALTVTDLDRSVAWYGDLLGTTVAMEGGDADRFAILVEPASGTMVGLRQPAAGSGDPFDEFRTGLDHLAFGVSSREELDNWEAVLRDAEVEYTPAAETPIGTVIVFRDPDGMQLEFWLPLD